MIYLDNAAATPFDVGVLDRFSELAVENYVNQEATHGAAYRLRKELQEAGTQLAELLTGNRDNQVCWATSGTEALFLAAQLPEFRSGNLVTTAIEHPALAAALAEKEENGREVRRVRVG